MSIEATANCSIFIPPDCDEGILDGFFLELDSLLEEGVDGIDIDCSLLDHTRSGHINALWDALTRCEEAGVKMRLTSVGYGLERLLQVLDLYPLFTLEPSDRKPQPGLGHMEGGATRQTAFSAEFEPGMDDISNTFIRFHDFLKKLQVSEMHAFDLETVFYEVSTNIFRHGGLPSLSSIRFSATLKGPDLELRFQDEGKAFDPTGYSRHFDHHEAILHEERHGLGITMIQRLVDGISYERADGIRNVVTIRKRVK
jgi:anti-sigma regulatory factor (Ser/Thr protein kinase)/anti-anti-sigma regulatory factor